MTLIEIVAGLVVLAVLVSSLTIARGRLVRQWGDAQRKLAAAEAVDRMLAGWLGGEGNDSIPVPARGPLEQIEGFTWRTNWVAEPGAARVGAGVVRLEVFSPQGRVLATDVLKHVRTRAEREAQQP